MANAHLLSSTLPPVEAVAAQLHDADVRAKKNSNIFTEKAPSGEEMMVSYSDLSDGSRAGVAEPVRKVYAAIDAAAAAESEPKTRKAG